jgi:hypothetical protein
MQASYEGATESFPQRIWSHVASLFNCVQIPRRPSVVTQHFLKEAHSWEDVEVAVLFLLPTDIAAAVAKPVLGRLEALFVRFLRPTLNKRRQVHGSFVAVRLHEFEEQDG